MGVWLWLSGLSLLLAISAEAQSLANDSTDTSQENAAPEWLADSLGRRTPRGTVAGFIEAVADENYNRAAHYLHLENNLESEQGAALAEALQRLLDQQGDIIPYSWISDDPAGNEDDNLEPDLDRIGNAEVDGENFDLFVEKTEGPEGEPIWLFSSQTVERIPISSEEAVASLVDDLLPGFLKEKKWGGVPIGHWMVMLVLTVLVYLFAWMLTSACIFIIRLLWRKADEESTAGIIRAFALPIRLYLAVWLLVVSSQAVGISIIVRQRFSELTVIVGLVSLLLLLWRLIDFITRLSEKQLTRRGNLAGTSAVLFVRRGAKIALIVFGIITILSNFGFDVTTGLAALGIGGIALALGAQKTVENFVGSVTLIADQPVRVGDFCKVGDTVGTVEQIGMRSTRIRTLDRTLVTIPNGEFSSLKIENYAHRDRFWFHPILDLRYETTPDQIRYLRVELQSMLTAHPKVLATPRVRFIEFGADSLKMEIFSYINALNFDEFLEIKEELQLRIMEMVEASGTGFAFPSQTLYFAKDQGVSQEKTQEAEEKFHQWQENGK